MNLKINIHGTDMQEVENYNYLGSTISKTGGTEEDINSRIIKAQIAFNKLNKSWRSNDISNKTKIKLFNSNIMSILLYGVETWTEETKAIQKLQVYINKSLRNILKIFWPNKISNVELWSKTNQKPVKQILKERKWRWIGHILRREDTNVTKQILNFTPPGKRRKGRPKETWKRGIKKDMENINRTWNEIKTIAKDRKGWKEIVKNISRI